MLLFPAAGFEDALVVENGEAGEGALVPRVVGVVFAHFTQLILSRHRVVAIDWSLVVGFRVPALKLPYTLRGGN